MTVYCVGDIHGCFDEFKELLDSVRFDHKKDLLLTTGDIIGRGPKPIETLQFFIQNKDHIVTVLGNHELSLLRNYSIWRNLPNISEKEKFLNQLKSTELKLILNEDNSQEILDYIRTRPMCYYDISRKIFLSHAGLSPEWTIKEACIYGQEVERILRSEKFDWFVTNMFSDKPSKWAKVLKKQNLSEKTENISTNAEMSDYELKRCIYIVNSLTRMRFCKPNLGLEFQCKDTPEVAKNYGLIPWFELCKTISNNETIIFGHWAALNGESKKENIIALDTGCVWNGALSLIDVDKPSIKHINKAHH